MHNGAKELLGIVFDLVLNVYAGTSLGIRKNGCYFVIFDTETFSYVLKSAIDSSQVAK